MFNGQHKLAQERFAIKNLNELKTFVKNQIIPKLTGKDVLMISGEMGIGKTQFVKYLAEELGCDETASPTFAIHHFYNTTKGLLHHLDLYRIENDEDLESTGFWDLFLNSKGIIAIEWAEKINSNDIPKLWNLIEIKMEKDSENMRTINLNYS